MSEKTKAYGVAELTLVSQSSVTPGVVGRIDWGDKIIDEMGGVGNRQVTGRRFVINEDGDLKLVPGRVGKKYFALIDVNKQCTIKLETGKSSDDKLLVKINNLTLKKFWEARTAIRRDWVLIGFANVAGAFWPFLLKFVLSLLGKVAPW